MSNEDWLETLKGEVAKPGSSQNKIAKELGVSSSMLSQVVRGIYPGNTEILKIKVKGKYMKATVTCPIKGELPINECLMYQEMPFSSANRERVRMYRACRSGCPHSSLETTAKAQRIDIKAATEEEVYHLDNQLAYLKRTAKGNTLELNQLLEKELTKLSARYNQLLWSKKYSTSEK
ncbi:hypothetical protein [Photobacterium sp.]|uniref:hypothetical protein n=1 Tax=Photobacterium sp. TaxID=660 RepID=UPI00299D8ACC|nr:hypothetical protein [Photobacterium sp.]MDX1301219.1 hypothetical protein [Photobacterium sp.]